VPLQLSKHSAHIGRGWVAGRAEHANQAFPGAFRCAGSFPRSQRTFDDVADQAASHVLLAGQHLLHRFSEECLRKRLVAPCSVDDIPVVERNESRLPGVSSCASVLSPFGERLSRRLPA
jgi:hypothetical protein